MVQSANTTEQPELATPAPELDGPELDAVPGEVNSSLPSLDVRAKRPTALTFLLHADTLRQALRLVILVAIDATSVFAAILTTLCAKSLLRIGDLRLSENLDHAQQLSLFAITIVLLNSARLHLYGRRAERPGLGKIATSLFQAMLVMMIFALVSGDRDEFTSYSVFYGSFVFATIYVAILRLTYESLSAWTLHHTGQESRALLIGPAKHSDAIAAALNRDVDSAIRVVGSLALSPDSPASKRTPQLGLVSDLESLLDQNIADEIIIADPSFPQELALEVVDIAHARGRHVRVAPSTMEILVQRAELLPGQAVPLFELRPPVSEGIDFFIKRVFDLAVSFVLMVVLSPFLIGIALAIKFTSRGPILYRSIRPGVGAVPFSCWKFRTMYENADQMQDELEHHNEADGAIFKMKDDPRVTSIGRLLRRLSLDELPQLINVIKGEMSLVGPRPLPQRDFDMLEDWHKKRYHVLPGMTGLWQVSGRSELGFDDMVRLDFLYLERWSVSYDLAILVKTVPAVFGRRGAF